MAVIRRHRAVQTPGANGRAASGIPPLGECMLPCQVKHLVDFAAITGDWFLITHSIGARGDVCVLLADRPNWNERRWDWARDGDHPLPEDLPTDGERFRIVHLDDGVIDGPLRTIDLPAGETAVHNVIALESERWLIFHTERERDHPGQHQREHPGQREPALGRVVDADGVVLAEFLVGYPRCAEAAPGGLFWLGGRNLRCLDWRGSVRLSLKARAELSDAHPKITDVWNVNVVSEDEVWVAFESIDWSTLDIDDLDSYDSKFLIARLVNGDVARLWAYSAVTNKAPVAYAGPFAVAAGQLLFQGRYETGMHPPRSSPDRDEDRLYLVSLNAQRSMELIPVNERGEWIGRFSVTGRGSLLYLETEQSLFAVDAATLPML